MTGIHTKSATAGELNYWSMLIIATLVLATLILPGCQLIADIFAALALSFVSDRSHRPHNLADFFRRSDERRLGTESLELLFRFTEDRRTIYDWPGGIAVSLRRGAIRHGGEAE